MQVPSEHAEEFATFPKELRTLVLSELAAGNAIVELAHSFPAAPCGAYIMLAHAVTSRPRASTASLSFYDRNGSQHSGEFTDAKRHFFVLEPPRPPAPEPDMNEIRAARDAAARTPEALSSVEARESKPVTGAASPRVARFRASLAIDYEKWREGIGYDLDVMRTASADERSEIEAMLLNHELRDWRDVEALACLDSPRARTALQSALQHGSHAIKLAVLRHAPTLVSDAARTDILVNAIKGSDIYDGLSEALAQVAQHHPAPVIEALFRAALNRVGGPAVHCAAMVLFLHGKAESSFDWEHRPFLLRFHTQDRKEREDVFGELCQRVGIDADAFLSGS